MTETEVLNPPKEEIKTDIQETIEVAAAIENRYGNKEKGKAITEKAKKDKEQKAKDEVKANENGETKLPENGKANKDEVIVTEEKKSVVIPSKEKDKKETSETKTDFFDPFEKPVITETAKDGKVKELPKSDEKPIVDFEKDTRFAEYKKKAETYDALKDDVVFQTFFTAKETGKNTLDALMEIAPVNYGVAGSTDIEKQQIDNWRAREYFSKVEGLTGAELDSAVSEFTDGEENNAKRRERNEHIRTLNSAQEKRFTEYREKTQQSSKKNDENITNFNKEVDQFLESIKEKKQLWGMQLTDAHLKSLEADTRGFFQQLFDKDGKINTSLIFSAAFFKNVQKDKNREIAEREKSKGMEEVLETVHLVDANENSLNNIKPQATEKTMETAIEEKFGGSQTKN